jgi:XTP/dITP diphosphohydrolase/tetrapyrrole methylase family protein/MazG family protein/ATP diphosphatase
VSLADALLDLQALTERLRRDCPWDREQTAVTIVPHTVEEAYEVADAALAGTPEQLLDELGDLLYQVYFLALLLAEQGHGSLEDVARNVHAKLVRRHPHVFGAAAEAASPGEVKHRWEELKAAENEHRHPFEGIAAGLPALRRARKVQVRAAGLGFEYPDTRGALADLVDELRELREAIDEVPEPAPETEPDARHVGELGDVVFAAVNVARRLNVDAEVALRLATDRFAARVAEAIRLADGDGRSFASLPLEEQDRYYDLAKEEGRP